MSARKNPANGQLSAAALPPPADYAPVPAPRKPPIVPKDFAAEAVRELRDYWTSKKPTPRSLPMLRAFDALELRSWSDNLAVYDVSRDQDGELVYRYRTVGPSSMRDGADHSGKLLHDVFPPEQVFGIVTHFNEAVDRKRPIEVDDTVPTPSGGGVKWNRLVLPLADEGKGADILMVLTYVEAAD